MENKLLECFSECFVKQKSNKNAKMNEVNEFRQLDLKLYIFKQ